MHILLHVYTFYYDVITLYADTYYTTSTLQLVLLQLSTVAAATTAAVATASAKCITVTLYN